MASGDKCQVAGSVRVPVRLEDQMRIFDILVVTSLPHYLILGVNFWCEMGIIPDLHSGHWTFRTEKDTETHIGGLETEDHLSEQQRQELEEFIDETFKSMGDKLGCTSIVEHVIRTKSSPIKQRHYPLSPALQKHVNAELDKMIRDGIVEPSTSPWASPIVLVMKSDGTYWFCVNYKRLNE